MTDKWMKGKDSFAIHFIKGYSQCILIDANITSLIPTLIITLWFHYMCPMFYIFEKIAFECDIHIDFCSYIARVSKSVPAGTLVTLPSRKVTPSIPTFTCVLNTRRPAHIPISDSSFSRDSGGALFLSY